METEAKKDWRVRLSVSTVLVGLVASCASPEPVSPPYSPRVRSEPICRSGHTRELVEAVATYRSCAFDHATTPRLQRSLSRYTDNVMAAAAVLATCRPEDEAVDAALLTCAMGDASEASEQSSALYMNLLQQTERIVQRERASRAVQ